MRSFYAPDIEKDFTLGEEESRHAIKVLRLKNGDTIKVIDGKGGVFVAEIIQADVKQCQVRIVNKQIYKASTYYLDVAIAPTKNADRLEWFVEKAIEIGVQKITLIQTERTERTKVRLDRLQKIAVAAMKQSKSYFLPEITEPTPLSEFLADTFKGQRFIAHCLDEKQAHLSTALNSEGAYQVLIGPEGDFAEGEIDLALNNNFIPVSLGENRLRTETAGVYVCAVVSLMDIQ